MGWLKTAQVCLQRNLLRACVMCACVLVSELEGVSGSEGSGRASWSPGKPSDPSVDSSTVGVLQQGSGKGSGHARVVS